MSFWMWVITIVGTWAAGAIISYILDGWFNHSNGSEDGLAFVTFGWPLAILFTPLIGADFIRCKLKKARLNKIERQEKQEKIRVATQKELENIEVELTTFISQEDKQKSTTA